MSASPRIEVDIDDTPQETVVRIKGEARVSEAGVLEMKLLGLQARRPPHVLFDLSELRFISSLGMGVLVSCRRSLVRNGSQVRFLPVLQDFVRTAFGYAGLLPLFGLEPTPEAPLTQETSPAPGKDVSG